MNTAESVGATLSRGPVEAPPRHSEVMIGGRWRDERQRDLAREGSERTCPRWRMAETGVKSEPGRKLSDRGVGLGPNVPACLAKVCTAAALTLKCTMASTTFAFRFSRSFCFTWWIMTNYSRIIVECNVLLPCKPAFTPVPPQGQSIKMGFTPGDGPGKNKNRLLHSNYLSRY